MGFSIKKLKWNLFVEGHQFATTNCMGTFEVDAKKLDLNACINGVSPKHRLKRVTSFGLAFCISILPEK